MESNNILAINIPNMVSIVIVAVVGFLILGLAAKGVGMALNKNNGG